MSRVSLFIIGLALLGTGYFLFVHKADNQAVTPEATVITPDTTLREHSGPLVEHSEFVATASNRSVMVSEVAELPLSGSAPTENVSHTIPLDEIRQGCFRQDCIPSVEDPEFVSPAILASILDPESIGIALSYNGEDRFYPFPMLETHELVNDVVAGDPLLISYCPLCGTGIVFDRRLDGQAVEFGVSGMLWQSNLLMYNRADELSDRNLWSQVLGEAVVGTRAGERLTIIPSDIMRFGDWAAKHTEGLVLTTGAPRDPYSGRYYDVARNFAPSFDETTSPLDPSAYIFGIELGGEAKAYPLSTLPVGVIEDTVGGVPIIVTNEAGQVTFTDESGVTIPDVEGFWFSWKAAHPDTIIWQP